MALSKIEDYILKDDVNSALPFVEKLLRESKNAEGTAIQVLNILSTALAKCSRNNHVCKSEIQYIFKLADDCCKVLNKTWKCNHSIFMQCIYFICKYFIEQNDYIYSRKLTLYFFEVKKHSKLPWNQDQKNILYHIFRDFLNSSFNKNYPDVFGTDDTSCISKWNFMFSIWQLNGYENKFLIFNALAKLLSRISDASITHRLGSDIFNQLCSMVNTELRGQTVIAMQRDFESLILVVDNYFWAMKSHDLKDLDHCNLIKFLETVDISLPLKNNDIIKTMITLILAFHQVEVLDLEKIKEDIVNYLYPHKELNFFTRRFINNLFFIINSSNIDSIDIQGDTLLKFVCIFKDISISLNSDSKKVEVDNSVSKIVIQALQVISNFREDKDKLESYFQPLCELIKYFFDFKNLAADKSQQHLRSAVFYFAKTIMSLYKHSLHCKAVQLAKILIANIRNVEFQEEPTEPLKCNVNIILSIFVKSSPPANSSYECLLYLLALSQDQNQLFRAINCFKHWCDLKLSPDNNVKEVTTFQIISSDKRKAVVGEDVLSWPFSAVPSFNVENLLLNEIHSYMKHRDLMGCAMEVYKIAVSQVKNKLILGRIVCCATRAVVETPSESSIFNKFLQTVQNIIKVISKTSPGELDEIDKHLVLGDLNYWLARYEISLQRTEAQSQVVNMCPKIEVNPNNPVPEDPLNCTVVLNAYSFISYNTQEKVTSKLSVALEMWYRALSLLQKLQVDKLKAYEFSVSCSLKYMLEQGYIYRLYKDVKQETTIWQLIYDISVALNVSKFKIIAFSELLSVLHYIDERIINEMKDYVAKQTDIHKDYYFYLFHIALYKNSLINNKKNINMETLDENKIKNWPLVHVQYNLVKNFTSSSEGTQGLKASREMIQQFHVCWRHSASTNNNFVLQTVAQCLLFEVSMMIGKMFCRANDVRLARLYSHKQLELAQQLHLPLRTCELLSLQAEMDLLCANTSDLLNKLSGIETVLELSHGSVRYEMHSGECKCIACAHIEYQIEVAYAILLKTGLFKLEQNSVDCFASLKDCWELLSKIKKKFNHNYVSDYTDCDIMFNIIAVEVFMNWGKTDKVSKYSEHAMKNIERSYKPFRFERSVFSLTNMKVKLNFPKLSSSVFSQFTEDEELEKSSTPIAPLELYSPPPIKYKVNSIQEDDKKYIQTNKRVLKKLLFQPTTEDNKVSKTNIPKSPLTNKNLFVENQKNFPNNNIPVLKPKVTTIPINKSDTIPEIVVTGVSDREPLSPKTAKMNESFLKPFDSNRKLNYIRKNGFVTPKKALVSVFCDQNENSAKGKQKRIRKKCLSSNVKKIPVIAIDSDSEEEFELLSSLKIKGNSKFNKEDVFIPVQNGNLSPRKKLFAEQDKSDNTSSTDICEEADEINLISSSDEASIINATVYEEPKNSYCTKLQLATQITKLEDKISTLIVTPKSPLAQPLVSNSVRKKGRRALSKMDISNRKTNESVSSNPELINGKTNFLEDKMSTLSVTPASPLAQPLVTNSERKKGRKAISKIDMIRKTNKSSVTVSSDPGLVNGKTDLLEDKMSTLIITPASPLAQPLITLSERKKGRKAISKIDMIRKTIESDDTVSSDLGVINDKTDLLGSQIAMLENDMFNLCVTPSYSLAQPLASTTVRKYTRRKNVKTDTSSKLPVDTAEEIQPEMVETDKNRVNTFSTATVANGSPKLCATPSPLAQPLIPSTVKKYSRRAKAKPNAVPKSPEEAHEKFPLESIELKKNLMYTAENFLTPVTVRTRSSRKLALSTTKVNRI